MFQQINVRYDIITRVGVNFVRKVDGLNNRLKKFRSKLTGYDPKQEKKFEQMMNRYMYSIYSYIQNEQRRKVGGVSAEFEYFENVHKLITVKDLVNTAKLIRVGNGIDGGYTMAYSVNNSDGWVYSKNNIAYSLGIDKNVDWDRHMVNNGYEVYMYDHTISGLPEENIHYHWKKLGITGGKETIELKHLDTLIQQNGHINEEGMLLKADIEGYEWEMFDGLDDGYLNRFDQIVLELHHLVSSGIGERSRIVRVLETLSKTHVPVHIHGNNNDIVEYCGDLVTPELLEVTYVKKDLFETQDTTRMFPTEYDFPNVASKPDIFLGKWNV